MDYLAKYRRWLEFPDLDEEISIELAQLADCDEEIASRFSQELKFGTGGMRGEMGAGTARVNVYVIRKITEGLASFIKRTGPDKPSVVVAYDTRHNSERFARETASVLVRFGIKVYLFDEATPVPILSFAIREMATTAGVMITASHNAACDNGYKIYWSDGGQITDSLAISLSEEIAKVKNELLVEAGDLPAAYRQGLLVMVGEEMISRYLENLRNLQFDDCRKKKNHVLKIIYTPLHGTGAKIIPRALQAAGKAEILLVPEQMETDPSCSTVIRPNPEDWEVFALAAKLGEANEADLLLATDTDADRLGVAVRDEGGLYVQLSGNQLGCLLLEYILSRKKEKNCLPTNGIIIKTVVSSEMGREIARSYGLETLDTLTGFKYIGQKIKELVDTDQKVFIFGYEESYGYLIGDFVRDKDAIQASQLTVEMAAFYKEKGMSLLQALQRLFERYGYFAEELVNMELSNDKDQVEKIMDLFRSSKIPELAGRRVLRTDDYLKKESYNLPENKRTGTGLPASNSIKFFLEKEAWFCVRPSGTEAKMKVYFGVKESFREEADRQLAAIKKAVLNLFTVEPRSVSTRERSLFKK